MNSEMLFELCRSAIQSGIVLLLQSCAVLLAGLGIGRAAHRFGPFVQSFIYRMTLATLAVLILTSVYAAPSMRVLWRLSLPSYHIAQSAPPSVGASSVANTAQPIQGSKTAASSSTPVSSVAAANAGSVPAPAAQKAEPIASRSWTAVAEPYFVGVVLWAIGALLLLGRIAYGQIGLSFLRRKGVLLSTGAEAKMARELCRERSLRTLPLRLVPGVRGPLLAGAWRPEIWFPEDFIGDTAPGVLRAVLAHEIAHFERSDNAWMLLARMVRALMWPQALLWALRAEMAKSAENACDALVVDGGCPRHEYAECLLLLTERLAPSRWERSLGASAVPFKSQIGRRIQTLMSASQGPRTLSRWMKAGVTGGAVVAIVAALSLVSSGVRNFPIVAGIDKETPWPASPEYLAQFKLASAAGSKAVPVMVVPIYGKPWPESPTAPSIFSNEDLNLLRLTKKSPVSKMGYGSGGGGSIQDRLYLENILKKRPHFFYTEYLIGVWCAKNGDKAGYQSWRNRALADAPAVIAGRIQFNDGRPVPGFTFAPSLAYFSTANFMENHSDYNDAQHLGYPEVTTDAQGCFYLPAYHAITEVMGWSVDNSSTTARSSAAVEAAKQMAMMMPQFPSQGINRFRMEGKVGVLPPMIVRPYMEWLAPITKANQSMDHPAKVHGATLKIAWKPYPGAASYDAQIAEVIRRSDGYSATDIGYDTKEPHFHGSNGSASTEIVLALSGNAPTFHRGRIYQISVSPRDAQGRQLSNSRDYYFQPLDALAPLPISKANVLKTFPAGTVVDSVTHSGELTTIRGTIPHTVNLQTVSDRDFFGMRLDHLVSKSHYVGGVDRNDLTFEIAYKR